MRHSLLSRFKGGFLGQLIGEYVLSNYPEQERDLVKGRNINTSITESLINYGMIKWEGLCSSKEPVNSSELALATLPIALFFHETPDLLSEVLESCAERYNPKARGILFLWSNIISLAAYEQLDPTRVIPQILNLETSQILNLKPQLEQVQKLVSSGTGLEEVVSHFSRQYPQEQTSIALALYCFSCTPEDFRLCVLRAMRTGEDALTVAALTGVLAGVYNSVSGIPIPWRLKCRTQKTASLASLQAERLFAVWSGVYDLNNVKLPPLCCIY